MAIRDMTPIETATSNDTTAFRPRGGRALKAASLALATVVTVGVLAGCGGGSSGSTSSAPTSSAATSSSSSSAAQATTDGDPQLNTAPAARSGNTPTPDADERKEMVYILEAVDPGMGTDDDALVAKSVKLCGEMLKGGSTAKLDAETSKIFTNGSYVPQGEQVTAIQLLMTTEFCR